MRLRISKTQKTRNLWTCAPRRPCCAVLLVYGIWYYKKVENMEIKHLRLPQMKYVCIVCAITVMPEPYPGACRNKNGNRPIYPFRGFDFSSSYPPPPLSLSIQYQTAATATTTTTTAGALSDRIRSYGQLCVHPRAKPASHVCRLFAVFFSSLLQTRLILLDE